MTVVLCLADKTMFRQQAYGQNFSKTVKTIYGEGVVNLYRGGAC